MFSGKKIVIGVSGGIAVYKACDIISMLKKCNAEVKVIMTDNSREFVTPLTFETLCNNEVVTNTFLRQDKFDVKHVSLAQWADLFVIVPATADVIGKFACGIADDMLSTTVMATKAPILICPAMNTNMFLNSATQENMTTLKQRGYKFVEPESGRLACGDVGVGKLAQVDVIFEKIKEILLEKQDFLGKSFLVSLGATVEHIDPIRYISNHSSGKMGVSLVKAIQKRGGNVTVVAGKHTAEIPLGVKVISVVSTEDMYNAIIPSVNEFDYVIMAAAPADYTVLDSFDKKYKGHTLQLNLTKTKDISKAIGEIKKDTKLICFAAETDNAMQNAENKLINKNADMIILNDVTMAGAGFNTDTNIVTVIKKNGESVKYPLMTKDFLADIILDNISNL